MLKIKSLQKPMLSFLVGIIIYAVACAEQKKKNDKFNIQFSDEPQKQGVFGKVGSEELSLQTMSTKDRLEYYELEKKIFEFKMSRIQKTIIEQTITAEAKKINKTFDDYLKNNIIDLLPVPSESEIQQFALSNHIEAKRIGELKERIVNYMRQGQIKAAIDKKAQQLSIGLSATAYFKKPPLDIKIDLGDSPRLGKDNAPVKIIEFSDFECPFCSKAAFTLQQIKKDKNLSSKIQVIFKHFPLNMHKNAQLAAEASLCVQSQSPQKFWDYHDLLFKNQDKLSRESLEKYAQQISISLPAFKVCLDTHQMAEKVIKDMAMAQELGIASAPTFFIGNEMISGAASYEAFAEAIQEALPSEKNP